MRLLLAALAASPWVAMAQTTLDDAYAELRAGRLESAVRLFEKGLKDSPDHQVARKDLGYALVRLGEPELARDQFREAMRRDPKDWIAALEYAFLCFETKQRAIARRVFDRVRREADGEPQKTAEDAFRRVDQALADAIEQWRQALAKNPNAYSVHEELARLYEERDDPRQAEEHFSRAFGLRPDKRHLLLDLARVRQSLGRDPAARAAYAAASRASEVRVAEKGREGLGGHTVSLEELSLAAALEPVKTLLEQRPEELPNDLAMADKSYAMGFLKDALRYYRAARESDPANPHIALRLGWTQNMLGDDAEAYRWFARARRSANPLIAAEAEKAWRNLRPDQAFTRPTLWMLPMYSTRWRAAFSYGQFKQEFRLGRLPVRPYVSIRYAIDSGASGIPAPLSERSMYPGLGVATRSWHGIVAWAEAGGTIGRMHGLDRRAGLAQARTWGNTPGPEVSGWFFSTNNDLNYASRFSNNVLASTQNRFGWTRGNMQFGWLGAAGADAQRQYWGNFLETGPSLRLRAGWMPPGLFLTIEGVAGMNFGSGNPRSPVYTDLRLGLWYALTY